jgi:hypothetical protein
MLCYYMLNVWRVIEVSFVLHYSIQLFLIFYMGHYANACTYQNVTTREGHTESLKKGCLILETIPGPYLTNEVNMSLSHFF